MEATRRVIGWFLIGVAVVFILYARYSHLMPEIIEAPSTEWDRLIIYLYLDTNSIIGLPLRVFSTIIIAFILFGRVLYAMNADKFLTEASLAIMGRYRGGPAKVAVGASSLFGTISGSVVSNVVMDGPDHHPDDDPHRLSRPSSRRRSRRSPRPAARSCRR